MRNSVPPQLQHKEIIKCVPKGKYIGNYRCHVNCLSYARNHPKRVKHIVGVAQVFNDDTCVAHFVLELTNGAYFDPTYGNMSGTLDSYLIPIERYTVDTFNPDRELTYLKNYLFSLRNPILRFLARHNPY